MNGAVADKPARQVHAGDAIELSGAPPRYVSRGGDKLEGALRAFAIDPTGWRCVDVGASTGGFTDCLLQHGAAHVVAVDVGHGQLHPGVRHDPRVTVFERFHARDLSPATVGGAQDLAVADLSFISIRRVASSILSVLKPGGRLVALVKPQFEAGRQEVARARGVITDPEIHRRVRVDVHAALEALGVDELQWTESPLRGADGNLELLVTGIVGPAGCSP